ncbi:MAG: threonine--tRNA ligase [Promethearchaeota archaeon]
MRILAIHSDYIEIELQKKAINAAELVKETKIKHETDCLVVFTTVEKNDESDVNLIARKLVKEIEDILKQINEKTIVLYPYAHLSSHLARPKEAIKILKSAEEILRTKKYTVIRAPFGWYKAFKISCKGHPLSELARVISLEEEITREEIVSKIKSKCVILTPDGKEFEVNLDNRAQLKSCLKEVNNTALEKYIYSEELESIPHEELPSIKAMQQLEYVGYAPEADPGHFKLFPKGKLIFDLLSDWAYEIAVNRLHALEIDTPILYNWDDPEIREQGTSFHERQYLVYGSDAKKKMILRFAGDFGLFKMMKNATISYKNLPLRIYEFSKSFRYEQRGELSGLRRLRAFHMPDIHCFTAGINEGWDEYQELYRNYDDLAKVTGIEFAIVFRIVDTFYEKNKNKIIDLLKYSQLPAFIEIISEMKHYWAVKHEFQGIDAAGGNCQLSTVQLDVKDSATYGLEYTDRDGQKKPFIIVHSSLGSIERWMFSILEDAFKKEKPIIPCWLAPTQVRIIPVKLEENILEYCHKITEKLINNNIRVDIYDLEETLSKKIRNSEKEWIPYIIVIGRNELGKNKVPIRMRAEDKQETMSIEEIVELIRRKIGDMPFRQSSLPLLISKQPIFY